MGCGVPVRTGGSVSGEPVLASQLLPFGDAAALEAFGDFERAVYSR